MAYWGSVVDNARRVAEKGDAREVALITPLLKTAYEMLSGVNVNEEKILSAPAMQIENNRMRDMNFN